MKIKIIQLHDNTAARDFNHSFTVSAVIKKTVIYSVLFILGFILMSYSFVLMFTAVLPGLLIKYIFGAVFLIAGAVHVFLLPKYLSHLQQTIAAVHSLLLSVSAGIVVWLVFYFTQFSEKIFALNAASAFALPCTVAASFNYYISIPAKQYKQWLIPAGVLTEKRKSLLMNSISIKLKIKLQYFDATDACFPLVTPPLLSVGDTFRYFLQSHEQENIELKDNNSSPYAWQFTVKKWFRSMPLDPSTSLQYNGVKENDTIIISRIKTTAKFFPDINLI